MLANIASAAMSAMVAAPILATAMPDEPSITFGSYGLAGIGLWWFSKQHSAALKRNDELIARHEANLREAAERHAKERAELFAQAAIERAEMFRRTASCADCMRERKSFAKEMAEMRKVLGQEGDE